MKFWILPLSGKGLRLRYLGNCKPIIKIKKKFIIEWFLQSIKEHISANDKILLIILKDQEKKFLLKSKILPIIKKFFRSNNIMFEILDYKKTSGPAETVFLGIKKYNFKNTTIIANHDQFVKFEFPKKKFDIFIPIYFNDSDKSSYVKIKNSYINNIVEKKNISYNASSGIYGFKNLSILKLILKKALKKKPHFNNEYFIGPSINNMKYKKKIVPTKTILKFDLGSTKGVKYFKEFLKIF